MIDLYTRLHREEQASRRAMGEEPSKFSPMAGLAIGFALSLAGWLAIIIVVTFFRIMFS